MKESIKRKAKNILTILVLFGLFLFFFATPYGMRILGIGTLENSVNIPLPSFTVYDLDNNEVFMGNNKGKALLINFFSVNCSACIAEIPHLKKIKEYLRNHPFELIAISEDWDIKALREFLITERINFTVFLDRTGEGAQKLKVRELPTSFIVSADNTIQKVIRGPILNENHIIKTILGLIENVPSHN